jgi:hypothetical protein
MGGMREIELDDDFWPAALAALASDAPASRLHARWPGYAELLDDLVGDADREPQLVGARLATHGRNPRLFAVLTGALLARSGVPTLVLDLSPDIRWLEQLMGGDFKEGLVDHLRFDVPLERCVRPTAYDRLSIMSGGAWFLAGSPLDDAPGFRAALEALRQRHRAVVVTLPPPLELGDRTGFTALCDTLITVEERSGEAPLVGSERAIARLVGDPDAARDLAQLGHRFLGPLPAVLAGLAHARAREAHAPEPESTWEPEPATPEPTAAAEVVPGAQGTALVRAEPRPRARPRPGRAVAVAAVLALLVLAALGLRSRHIAADLAARIFASVDEGPPYAEQDGEAMIVLDPAARAAIDSAPASPNAESLGPPATGPAAASAEAREQDLASSTSGGEEGLPAPAGPPGRPTPFSIHVGSYQRPEAGLRVVDRVARMGHVATLAPVSLAGKGRWYRVYVGSFADSVAARRLRDRLRATEIVEEGFVRPAPWSFEIGVYASREEARAAARALRDHGIAAYSVGEGPVRLYAGAYQSREEAELLARALETALEGRTATLTLREE